MTTPRFIKIKRMGRWSWLLTYHLDDRNPFVETAVILGTRRRAERIADRKLRREAKRARYTDNPVTFQS